MKNNKIKNIILYILLIFILILVLLFLKFSIDPEIFIENLIHKNTDVKIIKNGVPKITMI